MLPHHVVQGIADEFQTRAVILSKITYFDEEGEYPPVRTMELSENVVVYREPYSFRSATEANKSPMPEHLKRRRDRLILAWEYWIRKKYSTLSPARRASIKAEAKEL